MWCSKLLVNKPMTDKKQDKLTFKEMLQSVAAAFMGVQSDEARERDFKKMTPAQFILLGVVTTSLFIGLIAVVVAIILTGVDG